MIVLVNAISIKEGGSLVVLRELLRRLIALDDDIEWHVAVNEAVKSVPELIPSRVTAHYFSIPIYMPLYINCWYNLILPRLLRNTNSEILFSMTNYLPDVPLHCPTLLLEQHAGHFSKEFDARMKKTLSLFGGLGWWAKQRWVIRSLKKSTKITVQTKALADAIVAKTGINGRKIRVISHGPGVAILTDELRTYPVGRIWNLGYITKIGVQKNFEVLVEALVVMAAAGEAVQLHLTLNPERSDCRKVLELFELAGVGSFIVNHGELDERGVRKLYSHLDLFLFPSLCESFGFPLLEAMAQGIPLLASDIDSNIEILGSPKYSFAAHDAEELVSKVRLLMNEIGFLTASAYLLARANHFSWDNASLRIKELLVETVEEVKEREK